MVFQNFEIIIRFPGARAAHPNSELNPIPSATLFVLLTFRNLMQFGLANTPFMLSGIALTSGLTTESV